MRSGLDGESGVALGLAILLVVVVGVIGAGLLVFARTDLESVIRANQGQRAFYAADAGIQAAKRHLLGDASPASYDTDGSGGACDSPSDEAEPVSSEWADGGAERGFGGGGFVAEIRWLSAGCGRPAGGDPNAEYFEIVSTGTSGETRRRIEAVYETSGTGAPLANYAAGDITIGGGATVSGVSVFGGGDVEVSDAGSLRDTDEIYGDWRTEDGAARPVAEAGIGAVGEIADDRREVGRRDFDGGTTPRFVGALSGSGTEVSFPFDPAYFTRASVLDLMREEATSQGNFRGSGGNLSWPEGSTVSTVVYVETDETVSLTAGDCPPPGCRGTLVVEGGDFVMGGGSAFRGAVVAAGGEPASATVEEGARLKGFVVSSGSLDVRGEVRAIGREEAMGRPGFYGVELWSWRELYE